MVARALCLLLSSMVLAVAAAAPVSADRLPGVPMAWGNNYIGQVGDGTLIDRATPRVVLDMTEVTAVAAGSQHSVALKSDGTVWTWGDNQHGQLGDGTFFHYRNYPAQVVGQDAECALGPSQVIGAGGSHTLTGLTDSAAGRLLAWGRNDWGQLGDGTTTSAPYPVYVSGLTDALALTGGDNHSLAVATAGQTKPVQRTADTPIR